MDAEDVDQIARVEADREWVAGIGDLEVFARLALIRIARRELEPYTLQMQLDAARALAREQRDAPQRREKIVAIRVRLGLWGARNDLAVIGKLSFHEPHEERHRLQHQA